MLPHRCFRFAAARVHGAAAVAQVWQRRTLSIDRDESSAGLRLLRATKKLYAKLLLPQKNFRLEFNVHGSRLVSKQRAPSIRLRMITVLVS